MSFKQSAYEVLGVEKENTTNLKAKYIELVKKHTPEHEPEKFMEIRQAFEQLTKTYEKKLSFFLYKKPLSLFQNPKPAKKKKANSNILKEIFETPFGTNIEIEKLIND